MTRYLSLLTFTEQGLRNVQQSSERAKQFNKSVEAAGGKVISQYWSVGEVDGCILFEVPNEETAASLLLALGKLGNVHTRSLRVYDEQEFSRIVAKA
jgi:uncharacterized protein with GYD domain